MLCGAFLPLTAYVNGTYFTIRSGGMTFITFLFDCVFTWAVSLPIAFVCSRFTVLSVEWIYFFVLCSDLIKMIIGALLIHSGIWARNMVGASETAP